MRNRLKILIYYSIIYRLPHSRYSYFFNRIRTWYVSSILGIMKSDKGNYFENRVYIGNASGIKIGSHCHINENVFIKGATIGNYVMVAPGAIILNSTHNTERKDIPMVMQGEKRGLNPIIEDDVWNGRNAIILLGIVIKKGSIVGAGAIVTKNVESYSIEGGVPAKLIKKRI